MAKQVLIVEDYDDARDFMKLLVENFGYETLTAANGADAVEITRAKMPDLIIMDLTMPKMDGIAATEIIRSIPGLPEIPIIALTAHSKFLAGEAIKAGCNEVVGKPIDASLFQLVLDRYLRH